MKQCFYVYIVTNEHKTVLYTGITNHLTQLILEHYSGKVDKSFTSRYKAFYLLYYEQFPFVNDAIAREKEIKSWNRQMKMQLINQFNPQWNFLNKEVFDVWPPIDYGSRLEN